MSATSLTTTASSTSSSASPSQSPGGGSGGGGLSASGSKLYLYTFLTTLLLLLGVSCAIIARSLILRRRFRRRVQEAIANGVFVPGLMDRPGGREVGEKPVFWEVWLGQPASQMVKTQGEKVEEKENWEEVLPVSVTKLPSPTSSNPTSSRATPHQIPAGRSFLSRLFRGSSNTPPTTSPSQTTFSTLESQPQPSTSEKPPSTPSSPSSPSSKTEASPVQLSLLIAMPSAAYSVPSHTHSSSSDGHNHSEDPHSKGKLRDPSAWNGYGLEKGEIPHLEFGVLEVGYRGEVKKGE